MPIKGQNFRIEEQFCINLSQSFPPIPLLGLYINPSYPKR